jgi:hypothetical protein
VTEIARLFGIPGWMINDQEKSTSWGTGMEQQFTAFVILTLKPYMQRIEQRITREVLDPRSEKAEFKVEGLLRGDSQARASFYNSGIQPAAGWCRTSRARWRTCRRCRGANEPYLPHNTSAEAARPGRTGNPHFRPSTESQRETVVPSETDGPSVESVLDAWARIGVRTHCDEWQRAADEAFRELRAYQWRPGARAAFVSRLHQAGMSVRKIAAVVDLSIGSVHGDIVASAGR